MPRAAWIANRPATASDIADLFVYGTLTNPVTLQRVLGRTHPAIGAVLMGYRRHEGKYPYLVRASGRALRGWVLRKLGRAEFECLDHYEVTTPQRHHGAMSRLYCRELVKVVMTGGVSVHCWVYMPFLDDWPASWR